MDASGIAVGAVLTERERSDKNPITYASCKALS